jgi:hypothetical protein
MRLSAILIIALGLGGCAKAPAPTQAIASAGCIPLAQVAGRRIAGPEAVEFEMSSGLIYRNQLQSQCPGMQRLGNAATIGVASAGEDGLLCRGDRIRVSDPIETRATGALREPSCVLGDFVATRR